MVSCFVSQKFLRKEVRKIYRIHKNTKLIKIFLKSYKEVTSEKFSSFADIFKRMLK
jgi:hypothetical protein